MTSFEHKFNLGDTVLIEFETEEGNVYQDLAIVNGFIFEADFYHVDGCTYYLKVISNNASPNMQIPYYEWVSEFELKLVEPVNQASALLY